MRTFLLFFKKKTKKEKKEKNVRLMDYPNGRVKLKKKLKINTLN
jgi:hypothetical protein